MQFASRMNIPTSETLSINTVVVQKQQAGEQVYNLCVGEPMIPTSQQIIDAAIEAMHAGKTLREHCIQKRNSKKF